MLCLIVARAANGVIGANNALPWKLPEDLQYFKRTTLGCPVIMGRKTWDSIGRPLPGRRNIVVTRNTAWQAAGAGLGAGLGAGTGAGTGAGLGAERAGSLAQAIEMAKGADRVFVIGGSEIFAEALPLVQRAYVTEIAENFAGDATFPALTAPVWKEISREDHSSTHDDHNADGFSYAFVIYEKQLGA